MRQFYDLAQAAADWQAMELPTGHDAMVTVPERLTEILLEWDGRAG
jgi:hypothetical protein